MPDHVDFLKNLSIFKPMLDYKKLIEIHYNLKRDSENINLYRMFVELFKEHPIENKTVLDKNSGEKRRKLLTDIKDMNEYFSEFKKILSGSMLTNINTYLKKYFNSDIKIEKFTNSITINHKDEAIPTITLDLEFKEKQIEEYHHFLNEAKLSEVAMSIFFATIKKLMAIESKQSFKILVLDDLLISLDMNNRLKLLEILKNEFTDFQIFFFTHDKELFEMYKDKMNWKKYELYLDDSEDILKAIMKTNNSDFERAKMFYAKKEYDISAFLLRKEFDKLLKSFLLNKEKIDRNGYPLDLSGLIDKAKSKTDGKIKSLLEKLDSDRRHILNPLSHRSDVKVYSEEIRRTIDDLVELKMVLR